jgi:quercetin dioxygenase-like cupin family protein
MIRALVAAIVLAAVALPAGAQQWLAAPQGQPQVRDLERLLAEQPLAPGENIKAIPLVRNERVAQLLVQVRDREPLHYHADSDLSVFLLRGSGRMQIGGETRAVRAGDVLHIPRGVPHAYINTGPEPGVAFVVMSPPPGPADRVLVDAPAVRQGTSE